MTIDRIIFLRICEDRGIEPYGRLQALINGGEIYPRLVQLFQQGGRALQLRPVPLPARKSDRQETPDELTLTLEIDDKTLKEILGNLYYPESPYEFSVLPRRYPGAGVRAVPGQGDPADGRAPRRGGG